MGSRFTISCRLPYTRDVTVGVVAPDMKTALNEVRSMVAHGHVLDNPECAPVLSDSYLALPLSTLDVCPAEDIAEGEPFPAPDASVLKARAAEAALEACRRLVDAYGDPDATGGSVEWSDVDDACTAARAALALAAGELPAVAA